MAEGVSTTRRFYRLLVTFLADPSHAVWGFLVCIVFKQSQHKFLIFYYRRVKFNLS